MFEKMSVEDVTVGGMKVLMRVDFNVPLAEGMVTDDTRIRAALPTIKFLLSHGARLALLSHLGRPKGRPHPDYKMDPVALKLSELLGRKVEKVGHCAGPEVAKAVETLQDGDLLILENVRFEKGEEDNDPHFARLLSEPFGLYVNDAFGTAHRAHASTTGVASYLPAVAGLLMKREIEELSRCLEDPGRPLTVILGGAKVSDKINVIRRFINFADNLLIGGGMANTFLAAQGYGMGKSLFEEGLLNVAAELLDESEKSGCSLLLPVDLIATMELKPGSDNKTVSPAEVNGEWKAVDIGPQTVDNYVKVISASKMILWNGPLGVFEVQPYHQGTEKVSRAVTRSSSYSVIGGGDLVAAVEKSGLADGFSFISTGGGATLEFWEGKELPGIAALQNKK